MPPKAKFKKSEIINVAFDLARRQGINAVTARELGKILNWSMSPIFTVCKSMEQVHHEVYVRAKNLYNENYAKVGLSQELPFKGFGMQYIKFAIDEPNLFQMLFMSEQVDTIDPWKTYSMVEDNFKELVAVVQEFYQLSEEDSHNFIQQMWIFAHGIATLAATGVYKFSPQEIGQRMGEICFGLLFGYKNHKFSQCGLMPDDTTVTSKRDTLVKFVTLE